MFSPGELCECVEWTTVYVDTLSVLQAVVLGDLRPGDSCVVLTVKSGVIEIVSRLGVGRIFVSSEKLERAIE